MKSVEKTAVSALFLLMWIFPLFNKQTHYSTWIMAVCLSASVFLLMIIKNTAVSLCAAVITAFVPSVFQMNHMFAVLPAVPLIFSLALLYKKADEKKKSGNTKKQKSAGKKMQEDGAFSVYAGAVLSVVFSIAAWIYFIVKKNNSQTEVSIERYNYSQLIIIGLFFILSAVFIVSIKNSGKGNKTYENGFTALMKKQLINLHVAAFCCFIMSVIAFYVLNYNFTVGYEREFFFPWFIYVFLIVKCEDPVFSVLSEK